MDAFDRLNIDTGEVAPKFSRNEGKGDAFDRMPGPNNEFEKFFTNMFQGSEGVVEGTAKVLNKIPGARTALQVPLGIAQGTGYGIVTGLLDMIGTGEALSPDTIDELRIAHERAGKPFDEEEYINAVHKVASEFPTPGNVARMIEEKTDLPLTPKSRLDKFVNFASTAGKMAPEGATLRPLNVGLPKPVLGAGVATGKEVLDELDLLPEPVNELLSFLLLKQPTSGQSLSFGKKTKPSGMVERGFEGIQKPREVTPGKHAKITEKLEGDFKEVANKIIEESPIGETAKALAEDPLIKRKAEALMDRAKDVAAQQKNIIPTIHIKKEMANNLSKNIKGYSLSEYEEAYIQFMKKAIDKIIPENVTPSELVKQYRKNNNDLGMYFEPGSPKSVNNAKRDALLDHNRAIAQVMEKTNPELYEIFAEGNANWANIKNAEVIDEFIGTVFKKGKIDFKEMKDAFNDTNYQRIFKTALGEKGAAEFEQLMTDMLTSEKPYNMLKIAQGKGFWKEFAQTSILSYLNPKAGIAKMAFTGGKQGFKFLMNSLLDKPKLTIKLNRAVQDLKKGDFAAAEKGFKEVDAELLPKEPGKGSAKASEAPPEPVEIKGKGTPRAESKEAFELYGMKNATESGISMGDISRLEDIEPFLRRDMPGRVKRMEEDFGKPFKEILEDIYGEKFESPKKGAAPKAEAEPAPAPAKAEAPKQLEAPKKQIEAKEAEAPKESRQPKLIEYKPKPIEKQSLKERAESIARESFNEIMEGKEISKPQKDILKNTEVSLLQTRGKEQQYHGTGKPIDKLSSDIHAKSGEQNIYGPGFYTTDALDIADGYSKAKFAKKPIVYQVSEKTPQKIYDSEQPIKEFKDWWIEKEKKLFELEKARVNKKKDNNEFIYARDKEYLGSFEDYLNNKNYLLDDVLLNEKPKTVRDFYDMVRERIISENEPAYMAQEYFDGIQSVLEKQGYEGISHKGGLLTKNPEHKVKIYWKPENLEIQEFSYPKEFKKTDKAAKPPELPATPTKAKEAPAPEPVKEKAIIEVLEKAPERNYAKEKKEYLEFLEEKGEAFKKEKLREITNYNKELEKNIKNTKSGKIKYFNVEKLEDLLAGSKRTLETIEESLKAEPIKEAAKPKKIAPEESKHLFGKESLSDFKKSLVQEHKGLKIGIKEDGKDLILSTFIFPENLRSKGTGTKVLKQITDYADVNKKTIYLSPKSPSFKAADDLRLENFYKRNGFKENKNRHKDGYPKELMVRKPEKVGEVSANSKAKSPAKLAQEKAAEKGKSWEEVEKEMAKKYPESKFAKKELPQEKVNIVKRQDITPKGLKEQKQWLVKQLDEAIAKAPEGYEEFYGNKLDQSRYGKHTTRYAAAKERAEKYDLLTFEIPGDGTMKIRNHKKALEAFKASVEKRWPEKAASAPQKKNTSVPKLTKEELDSMRVR